MPKETTRKEDLDGGEFISVGSISIKLKDQFHQCFLIQIQKSELSMLDF